MGGQVYKGSRRSSLDRRSSFSLNKSEILEDELSRSAVPSFWNSDKTPLGLLSVRIPDPSGLNLELGKGPGSDTDLSFLEFLAGSTLLGVGVEGGRCRSGS